MWTLRFEVADLAENVLSTSYYNIQLDNTTPEANISLAAGRTCSDFSSGERVTGTFVARDRNFGSYTLTTKPASLSPRRPTPTLGYTQTVVAPGNDWGLETAGMTACGYVVELSVADTTIRHSQPGVHNTGYDDVGFCLK